jgi:hypothetical protein
LMGTSYAIIAHDANKTHKAIGMYACSFMPVHINGKNEQIGYIGGLRVSPEYQHKIRYLKEGFTALETIVPRHASVPFYFTSLASENHKARRVLEANTKGMPHYTPQGEMSTLIFSTRHAKAITTLQQATPNDCTDIASFYNTMASHYQLSPHITPQWLEGLDGSIGLSISDFWLIKDAQQNIRCCLALWDQRAFKQSVIKAYRPPLQYFSRVYNAFARLSKRVELPKTGEALEHLYIAFFACDDASMSIDALKEAASIARQKGASSCVLGVSSHHALLDKFKHALKPSVYRSEIETVVLHQATTSKPNFDGRLIQPEVALL